MRLARVRETVSGTVGGTPCRADALHFGQICPQFRGSFGRTAAHVLLGLCGVESLHRKRDHPRQPVHRVIRERERYDRRGLVLVALVFRRDPERLDVPDREPPTATDTPSVIQTLDWKAVPIWKGERFLSRET